jgi:hypothetical protein
MEVEAQEVEVVGSVEGSAHAGRTFGAAGGHLAIDGKMLIVMLPSGFKVSIACKEPGDRLAYYPMCSPGLSRARQSIVEAVDVGMPLNAQEAVVTGLGAAKRPTETQTPQAPQALPWRPGMKPQVALPVQEVSSSSEEPTTSAVSPSALHGIPGGADGNVRRLPKDPMAETMALFREGLSSVLGQTEAKAKLDAEAQRARDARAERAAMVEELRQLLDMKIDEVLPPILEGRIEEIARTLAGKLS